jgi:phenylacetate-CoA ligase
MLAPFVRYVIAPAWAAWERSPYLSHYRQLVRRQYDSPQDIRQRQWAAIQRIVEHAYATVPYWRQTFDELGKRPEDIRQAHEFASLPVLEKSTIRQRGKELLSTTYQDEKSLHQKRTSGSTGVTLTVTVDEAAQQWKRASTVRFDEWTGWRLGQRVAMLWGNPEYRKRGWRGYLRNALLERARYLDTLKMDEAQMARFAHELRRRPPALILGHAHSLFLFAEFLRPMGGPRFRPRGIISTAMVLHDWQRKTIEDVFRCKVTNRYGCEEVSLIASECERHDGLHINADGVYVEILRPDGTPCDPGEAGSVVVTDLANRAMPIIRYKVGDTAAMSARLCPCSRGLPLLERLMGREADYVVTPAGEYISGISLTENFAVLVPGVTQIQIVQEQVDDFVFRIVRGSDFGPASRSKIHQLVEQRFGPGVNYRCEFVERIPQEPSGKYRFCISKVENPYTRARDLAAR